MCKILILFIYFFTNSYNSHHLRAERTQPILVSRQHSGDVREISVCRHQNFDKSAATSLSSGKILTFAVFVAVLVVDIVSSNPIDDIIIGQSAPAKELKKLIEVVSDAPTSVLVLGETGTGKELVARAIHAASGAAASWYR